MIQGLCRSASKSHSLIVVRVNRIVFLYLYYNIKNNLLQKS